MKRKRILPLFLAILLGFLSIVPTNSIFANDSVVPLGRQWITGEDLGEAVMINPNMRATVGSSTTITPGTAHSYGSWGTNEFSVSTETGSYLGFCAEPNSATPSGTFTVSKLNNDVIEALVLTYVIPELWNSIGVTLYTPGYEYVFCHAAIGYAYCGSLTGLSGTAIDGIKGIVNNSIPYYIANNTLLRQYLTAYELHIAYNDSQDIVWVEKGNVVSNLTIYKRSYTDVSLIDGYKYLSGLTFELYAWTGSDFSRYVTTSVDNGNGSYTFKNVNKNLSVDATFLVKEVKSKEGYSLDYHKYSTKDVRDHNVYGGRQFELHDDGSWTCFSLTADPTNTNPQGWGFEFLNYPEDRTVAITKVDATDESKILSGAKFGLYAYQKRSDVWDWYKIGDFEENPLTDEDGNSVTDEDGNTIGNGTYSITFPFDKATLSGSKYSYSIIETSTPEGYKVTEGISMDNPEEGYKFSFTATGSGTTEFTIGNLPSAEVLIHKSSADPYLTDNNDCYSLEGAEYTIYKDEECTESVATLITDEFGETESVYIVPGTYWIKETTAPYGYALDEEAHKVVVGEDQINEFWFEDEPLVKEFDPYAILLGKVDAETNLNRPQGSGSLGGAHFEIKFFEGDYEEDVNPEEEYGIEPSRVWVFETNKNGYCRLSESFFAEGYDNSELYYLNDDNIADLPLGTLVITEIKAPTGYQIYEEPVIRKVEIGGGLIAVYNEPTIPETPLKVSIFKQESETGTGIPGVEFTHVKPDGNKETAVTDEEGYVYFYGLEQGDHIVYESKAGEGYKKNNTKIDFYITEDNEFGGFYDEDSYYDLPSKDYVEFGMDEDGNGSMTFWNDYADYSLNIHKLNDNGTLLDGAEFTLYGLGGDVIDVATSENGVLTFKNLEIGTDYYFKETKAPDGYSLPEEPKEYSLYVDYEGIRPLEEKFEFYIDGVVYTAEDTNTEKDVYLSGTVADRVVNVKVVNEVGMLLPETGSIVMIPLFIAGVLLTVVSVAINKKD